MSISFAMKNPSEAYDNLSLSIKKARMSKNIYEMLCVKYNERIKVLDEQITEVDKVKKEYTKKCKNLKSNTKKCLIKSSLHFLRIDFFLIYLQKNL
jgi:hypothetical protein